MEKDICFKVNPGNREVTSARGKTLLEAILDTGIEINHSCGGGGSCGTCRVLIKNRLSEFPKRNEIEKDMAKDRKFLEEERLSCQITVVSGAEVLIP